MYKNYDRKVMRKYMRRVLPKTIRARITVVIMISTIVTTMIISYFCLSTFQRLLRNNLIQSTGTKLQLVMKNIENNMDNIENLAKWCCTNSQISSYVVNAPDRITGREALSTYYRMQEELLNSRSSNHVRTLLISNYRNALLQNIDNTYEGMPSDGKKSRELPYFQELIQYSDFKWIGLKDDPFSRKSGEYIIPIIRPIYSSFDSSIDGWVYISVKANIITDYLQDYALEDGSDLYVIIDDHVYLYKDNSLEEVSEAHKVSSEHTSEYNDEVSYYRIKDEDSKEKTIVSYSSNLEGWYIAQSISDEQFSIQKSVYFPIMILIIVLLLTMAFVLAFIFNRMINRPIRKINRKIRQISGGDFSQDKSIESEDEIGTIGRGINVLSQNVLNLIESRVEDEKQKKELEFRMLQSQINPHFLYNTLNSIKWMATIQNASGIPEMTTALARLLKNIAKGTSEIISMKEELNLLKDYITIQQYKYGGTITVDYDITDEELYECSIIKFTLQPVVENAIFHGIEPKGTEGTINIKIKKAGLNKVVIEVIDDGVGISEDKIQNILTSKETCSKGSFNNIGISNVDERIKLTFGNEYGLDIKSRVNEYTDVIITIPYETVKDIT